MVFISYAVKLVQKQENGKVVFPLCPQENISQINVCIFIQNINLINIFTFINKLKHIHPINNTRKNKIYFKCIKCHTFFPSVFLHWIFNPLCLRNDGANTSRRCPDSRACSPSLVHHSLHRGTPRVLGNSSKGHE